MLIANWQKSIARFESQCDWVGIREYQETTDFIYAKNGKGEEVNRKVSHGVMIEVLHNGQFAYAGTSNLSDKGVENAFLRALGLAKLSSKHRLFAFSESARPRYRGEYESKIVKALDSESIGDIQRRLIALSNTLSSDDAIVDSWAWARLVATQIYFESSNGSQWQQVFTTVYKDFGVTAKKGSEFQSRSYGLNGLQCGLEDISEDAFQSTLVPHAERIIKEARDLLNADECPSDLRDLIITPDQLYLQVHESIGHPLELDRILGDERNYAGWSFISLEDFGTLQYGSNIMNVTFDPCTPNAMASYAYDDNGVAASKEHLIKDGLLLRGIGGIESQQRAGLPGVACARSCDWNRPAMDRMANINLEPGDSSLQDMIDTTEKGIVMQTNRSWSIDDYRNKFQFGCEYAQLIEDGKLTRIVKNPNYRGVTQSFWHNLTMVGNQDTFEVYGSPFCGKGEPNQVIRVGHAVPTCLFENVEVFGGA